MSNEPNLIWQNNNFMFKSINTNIIFDYEKYKCSPELHWLINLNINSINW